MIHLFSSRRPSTRPPVPPPASNPFLPFLLLIPKRKVDGSTTLLNYHSLLNLFAKDDLLISILCQ